MKDYKDIYKGEGSLTIKTNGDMTVIDLVDKEGIKTWCFHGSPFNFMLDKEKEKVKNHIKSL